MKTINGEAPFQINETEFAISPSTSGYTLNYSANGKEYTPWDSATPSGETLVVSGVAQGMFFKLVGNTGDVEITY